MDILWCIFICKCNFYCKMFLSLFLCLQHGFYRICLVETISYCYFQFWILFYYKLFMLLFKVITKWIQTIKGVMYQYCLLTISLCEVLSFFCDWLIDWLNTNESINHMSNTGSDEPLVLEGTKYQFCLQYTDTYWRIICTN
jgi:hypothetical protein